MFAIQNGAQFHTDGHKYVWELVLVANETNKAKMGQVDRSIYPLKTNLYLTRFKNRSSNLNSCSKRVNPITIWYKEKEVTRLECIMVSTKGSTKLIIKVECPFKGYNQGLN